MRATVRDTLGHYGIYYEVCTTQPSELLFICPFHDDHSLGSASFNEITEVYNCFSCGAGGNIYEFVGKLSSCSTRDAEVQLENNFELLVNVVSDFETARQRVTDACRMPGRPTPSPLLNLQLRKAAATQLLDRLGSLPRLESSLDLLRAWYPTMVYQCNASREVLDSAVLNFYCQSCQKLNHKLYNTSP